MPQLKLSPDLSMYYEIVNSKAENPWLLLLHPLLNDLSWIKSFTEQPDIKQNFNCILFDQRLHGRTEATPLCTADFHTYAADVALAMQMLQLPPVHVLSGLSNSSEVALSLAVLFPEKVLSLFLCGLAPEIYSEFTQKGFSECFKCLVDPVDQENWEEGMHGLHDFCFYSQDANFDREAEIKVCDEWSNMIIQQYSPSKASYFAAVGMLEIIRGPTPQKFKDSITQPMMVCHGTASQVSSADEAFDRFKSYRNLDPRSTFERMPGAPLVIVPLYTPILTRKFMKWIRPILQDMAGKTEDLQKPQVINFENNLKRFAELFDRPEIANRDPWNPASYTAIEGDLLELRKATLNEAKSAEQRAISLRGENAPRWWTNVSEDEWLPWRFSTRFET